jgi:hypothetical protein
VEVAQNLGVIDVAVGLTSYYFDRSATTRLPHDVDKTYEIHARAEIGDWIVVPRAVASYDFDAVKGLFLEGGATFRIPLWRQLLLPAGSLLLEADAGLSLGQERNTDDLVERSYFDDQGLAYVGLSLGTTVGYIPVGVVNSALHVALHSQINQDDRTKLVGGRERKDVKWWISLTLTSIGPRCRPTRDLCPP